MPKSPVKVVPGPESAPLSADPSAILKARARRVSPYSRSSFPTEASGQVNALLQQYAPLAYMLPWEVLDYVELLSTFNPDYSQAVDNIRTLANSGHELFVDAKGKRAPANLKGRLEEKARTIQKSHGGIDGLIDKLLDQAATYGAMSGEWILNEDLDDVVEFVDINPKTIRYFWDKDKGRYCPYQKVTGDQAREAEKRGQKVLNLAYVELNEETFQYYAFDAAPGSPYGTPPFLAALANIAIQRDMVNNMAQIVRKIGLLGIMDLVIAQLPKHPGEDDDEYEIRANQYLDDYVEVLEDMLRDGGIAHFDDVELGVTAVAGNAAGATNVFKQNEELVFSGLKSMPSVQGRSYSTTETYAGVAYDIIIRNTYKYQKAVKRVIEAGYWLMATAWGETPDSIRITFNSNKSLHRLQDAQAEEKEIMNALWLWVLGILDQLTFAQKLGYSDVKRELEDPPIIPSGAKPLAMDDMPEEETDAGDTGEDTGGGAVAGPRDPLVRGSSDEPRGDSGSG